MIERKYSGKFKEILNNSASAQNMREIAKIVRHMTHELRTTDIKCCTDNNQKIGAHVISHGSSTTNNNNNNRNM